MIRGGQLITRTNRRAPQSGPALRAGRRTWTEGVLSWVSGVNVVTGTFCAVLYTLVIFMGDSESFESVYVLLPEDYATK